MSRYPEWERLTPGATASQKAQELRLFALGLPRQRASSHDARIDRHEPAKLEKSLINLAVMIGIFKFFKLFTGGA